MILPTRCLLFQNEPAEVYKSDRRSRVWRIDRTVEQGGPVVVKRFDYTPWRQLLAWLIGLHPAQRERRSNWRLRQAGLPVVPITAHGTVDLSWLGCRLWLACPYAGRSLQDLIRRGQLSDRNRRLTVLRTAAHLTIDLIRHRYYFRDLKPSNILIDAADRAWLIDVGAVRRSQRPIHVLKMLALLRRKARQDGVGRSDQLRFLRIILDQYPYAGGVKAIVSQIDRLAGQSNDTPEQPAQIDGSRTDQ